MSDWMQTAMADHLALAECTRLIAEQDLACGVVRLGGCLALLQRDLLAETLCRESEQRAQDSALSSAQEA